MTAAILTSLRGSYRKLGAAGSIALILLVVTSLLIVLGPIVWTTPPDAIDVTNRFAGPSLEHPLGTDDFGRDMLSRILYGGRLSLLGAVLVTAGETVLGLLIGAAAGTLPGRAGHAFSRLIDLLLALPSLVIAMALVGALGKSFVNLIIALVVTGWPWYARAYRGLFVVEQQREYVESARAIGVSRPRIITRHMLRNIAGPVLILITVNFSAAILNLTSLSFLGLGVQPPAAEWGGMVDYARVYFQTEPWQIVAPGLAIAITVLLANTLGDALRDALDPRHGVSRALASKRPSRFGVRVRSLAGRQ